MIIKENKDVLEETILQLCVFEEELRGWQKEIFAARVSAHLNWEKSLFIEIPAEDLVKEEVRKIVLGRLGKNLQEIIDMVFLARTNLSRKRYQEALLLIENLIARIEERLGKEKEDFGLLGNLKRVKAMIKSHDN